MSEEDEVKHSSKMDRKMGKMRKKAKKERDKKNKEFYNKKPSN